MIDPRSEEACALALRVEAAIKKLDARLAAREEWRDAVAEWRHCVQRFGPGSASANGVLLCMIPIAACSRTCIDVIENLADSIWPRYTVRAHGAWGIRDFRAATITQASAEALEWIAP